MSLCCWSVCILPHDTGTGRKFAWRQNKHGQKSERDTEQGHLKQEKGSDQPRQSKELVPKGEARSVTGPQFGYEKSDTDQKTILCILCCRPVPTTYSNTTNHFYHLVIKYQIISMKGVLLSYFCFLKVHLSSLLITLSHFTFVKTFPLYVCSAEKIGSIVSLHKTININFDNQFIDM